MTFEVSLWLVLAAVIFILMAGHYGFVRAIGLMMMLFGVWGLYQAYTSEPDPSYTLPIIGDIWTGTEKIAAMILPAIFLFMGLMVYRLGGDRRR